MSIWQTKNWQEMLKKSNQTSNYFEIDLVFFEKRSIWLSQYWLFALWVEEKQEINEEKVINLCKKEKCVFIQIESYNLEKKDNLTKNNFKYFSYWFYKKFITPYTAIIDLSKTEDEILSLMKPKWRYNIKLAIKKSVEIIEVESSDENIKIFYDLMLETTSRDSFSWNNLNYYKNFLKIIPNSKLLFAKYQEKIIASWIFVIEKEVSIYYYWASTSDNKYRNLMAPYLLQWEAIKISKEFKSKYYDFLWIATPWEIDSPLLWVTDFKLKITPEIREVSKSYIFINKKIIYFIFKLIKKIKSFL